MSDAYWRPMPYWLPEITESATETESECSSRPMPPPPLPVMRDDVTVR